MGTIATAPIRVPSPKIAGSLPRVRKETSNCLFGEVAKLVWDKPDTVIAELAGVSDRAARDYLNGKVAPPALVATKMLHEILTRK